MTHQKFVVLNRPAQRGRGDDAHEPVMDALAQQSDVPADVLQLLRRVVADALVAADAAIDLVQNRLKVAELFAQGAQPVAFRGLQIRKEQPQPSAGGQRVGDLQQLGRLEHRLLLAEFLQYRPDITQTSHRHPLASVQHPGQLGRLRNPGLGPTQIDGRV